MYRTIVTLQALAVSSLHRVTSRVRDDRGQSTAEYALVLLGAAAIALLLLAWATKDDKIGKLFDAVLDKVLSQVR
jgi:hypothetical protein